MSIVGRPQADHKVLFPLNQWSPNQNDESLEYNGKTIWILTDSRPELSYYVSCFLIAFCCSCSLNISSAAMRKDLFESQI